MTIKSILFVFNGEGPNVNALDAALSLGKACTASLRIIYLADQTLAPPAFVTSGGFESDVGAETAMISSQTSQLQEEATVRVFDAVTTIATRHGFTVASDERNTYLAGGPATFRSIPDSATSLLVQESRMVDLIVAGYDHRTHDDLGPLLLALHQSGRPVIAIPHTSGRPFADGVPSTIAIAWDGSRFASRAVREAIPLLRQASKVHILTVAAPGHDKTESAAEPLIAYLKAHDITAVSDHIDPAGRGTAATLLDRANDLAADLLVMGAYGHGHLAELVLGGVTNHVLKHTSVPVLLTH